jgi:FkbM family methyltransferase
MASGLLLGEFEMLSIDEKKRLFELHEDHNEFEALIERFYSGIVKPGDVVIDGGAHCAMHTIPLATLVGEEGRVLAFEPVPSICAYLRTLTAGYPQVGVWEAALADKVGEQDFVEIADAPWLSSRKERELGEVHEAKKIKVMNRCLDQFASFPITFIKLDLEGGEYHALLGGERLLETRRPVIVMECGREPAAKTYGYSADDFFLLFARHAYTLVDLFGQRFTRREFELSWDTEEVPHYVVATPSDPDKAAAILARNARESLSATAVQAHS